MQVDEATMHYLAGVLDAKLWIGVINMDRTYPAVRAQIPCDDYNTARLLTQLIRGGTVCSERSANRLCYKAIFTRRGECNNLLMTFAPYTRTKRELYDAVIEFIEYHEEVSEERKLLTAAAGGTKELEDEHREHVRVLKERAAALKEYTKQTFELQGVSPITMEASVGHRTYTRSS